MANPKDEVITHGSLLNIELANTPNNVPTPNEAGDSGEDEITDKEEIKRLKVELSRRNRAQKELEERVSTLSEDFQHKLAEVQQGHAYTYQTQNHQQLQALKNDLGRAAVQFEEAQKSGTGQARALATFNAAQFALNNFEVSLHQQQEQQRNPQPTPKPAQNLTASARRWLRDNDDWFNDPEYAAERAAIPILEEQYAREYEGEVGTSQYFKDFDKDVVDKRLPNISKVRGTERPERGRTAASGTGSVNTVNTTTNKLPKHVLDEAADWGLDVGNKDVIEKLTRAREATASRFKK